MIKGSLHKYPAMSLWKEDEDIFLGDKSFMLIFMDPMQLARELN